MPTACGYTWSTDLDTIIRQEAAVAGTPLDLAYTFIAVESGFDPAAHNVTATEDSVGLLQLNRIGGQGAGYSVEELKDPRRNLQIGLPYITAARRATWSPTIAPFEFIYLIAIRSGHPGQVDRDDYRIANIARAWSCFFPAAGLVGPFGAPGAVETRPGPGLGLTEFGGLLLGLLFLLPAAGMVITNEVARGLGVRSLTSLPMSIHPARLFQPLDPSYTVHQLTSVMRLPLAPARRPPRHPRAGRRPGG